MLPGIVVSVAKGAPSMNQPLTLEDLDQQPKNDAQRVMFYGFSVMIGTALGLALLSALAIAKGLYANVNSGDYLVRIPFWLVSMIAVCMVYLKLHIYGRFLTHKLTILDILIPLSKAFFAAGLFAVLSSDHPLMWHLWPLVFSIFALISHLKIRYYIGRFDETRASSEVASLIRKIKEHSKTADLRATLISAAIFATVWVLLNFVPPLPFMAHWSPKWQALLALPAGIGMVKAILSDKPIRDEIEKLQESWVLNQPTLAS
jgi:uncharacterized membrane protein